MARIQRRLAGLSVWSRLPPRWRTARLRLTLLYGGLVLGSGGALLGITYILVSQNPASCVPAPAGLVARPTAAPEVHYRSAGAATVFGGTSATAHGRRRAGLTVTQTVCAFVASRNGSRDGSKGLLPPVGLPQRASAAREVFHSTLPLVAGQQVQVQDQAARIRDLVAGQDAAELHQVEVDFAIALAIMALASLGIGWFASGRVLRPLRTMTATAREISASSLDRRLALRHADHELRELGDTFDSLLARLERSFEAQRQFVANASHELRTPLARQRTLAEVALADPHATPATLRAAHERVLAAGVEQERLIEALLTLARGQRGLDRLEPVDLDAAATEALIAREPDVARREIVVLSELAAAPTIGDDRLVGRLVANLVDNAVRHNRRGGSVEVRTRLHDGHAELRVANTGPVVPSGEVGRLMEPFHRAGRDRTGADGGLGLGLSIVEAIALAHGATLTVQAQPSGGLDVAVRFPARPPTGPRPPEPAARPHLGTAGTKPRARKAVAGEPT